VRFDLEGVRQLYACATTKNFPPALLRGDCIAMPQNKARQIFAVLVKRARLRHPTFQRIFGRAEEARGAGPPLESRFTRSPDKSED
jgi:hypothetical protein